MRQLLKKIAAMSLLFTALVSRAQIKDPVQWAFTFKKTDRNTYEVHLTATLEKGWHLYSQTTPEGGPVPTAIAFNLNPLLTLDGGVKEVGRLEQKQEPLFGVDVKQYSGQVDFVQVIRLKSKAKTALNGQVEFMACNNQECLPPQTKKFSIALK